MAKTGARYSSWVKPGEVSDRFTAPIGETITESGYRVVQFAKPRRINEAGLKKALEESQRRSAAARGSRP